MENHVVSLRKFGIGVKDVFLNLNRPQVITICSFKNDVDIKKVNQKYMQSSEFKADMAGFPMQKIVKVEASPVKRAKL